MSALPFTGERFTPECVREMWYEHWHRYALAAPILAGKRVLDAACGEGYGSRLLARSAAAVCGVDISAEAIGHARGRYGDCANLEFQVADCTALPFADASFDAIVSFETLEHLSAQDALLADFRRVLKPDGFLLISSPDKHVYSDLAGYRNEFHVKELYRDELLALIARHFPAHRLFGQKLAFQSVIWAQDQPIATAAVSTSSGPDLAPQATLTQAPVYFIVACAASADLLPSLPDLHLFGDQDESVYKHYEHEIRKNMQAGQIIQERDQRIAELEARIRDFAARPDAHESAIKPKSFWQRWFG